MFSFWVRAIVESCRVTNSTVVTRDFVLSKRNKVLSFIKNLFILLTALQFSFSSSISFSIHAIQGRNRHIPTIFVSSKKEANEKKN